MRVGILITGGNSGEIEPVCFHARNHIWIAFSLHEKKLIKSRIKISLEALCPTHVAESVWESFFSRTIARRRERASSFLGSMNITVISAH